ncbi:hypothetical protein QP860_09775 [Aerococcus sp. UMB1112A]|uniref:AbiTii domain-containing protein n=1 Tax=unclassified Aerococcus TaxID=2618060 RepID=UPI0008A506D7|nr:MULTISPECIES: hypothetical protein [unclassified Aerococcus]KAB0645205.1 hypothetical protein F6I01_12125 [Aerococcus sanguinicola]MDK6856379.1 hypothetical protein [Aerococcus sp. UMB7533]MDK8503312.1 hypothetical protein [Aerococcus sp. UMB1112A]OFN05355.1 hypothetical protein HMPREF2626_03545 [Aerococcus sp. HMSC062A02]OHO42763.1 hypothetical protein HMPREF2705_02550 [Aerococcus sp. HMSC035B07]
MSKSTIIKELIHHSIEESTAIERLYLIALELGYTKIIKWCENELQGYPPDVIIPDYRHIGLGVIIYSGVKGNVKLENAILQPEIVSNKFDQILEFTKINSNITSVKRISKGTTFSIDLNWLITHVYKVSNIQCLRLRMDYDTSVLQNIVSSVRIKLIKAFILLESKFGNLDNFDIDYSQANQDELNNLKGELENILFYDNKSLQ